MVTEELSAGSRVLILGDSLLLNQQWDLVTVVFSMCQSFPYLFMGSSSIMIHKVQIPYGHLDFGTEVHSLNLFFAVGFVYLFISTGV